MCLFLKINLFKLTGLILMAKIYAKDLKCCVCKTEQAVAFWPCIDPDIKSHPFCEACLKKEQHAMLVEMHKEGLFGT